MNEYFATCTLGLEDALSNELVALGATDVEGVRGGVRFFGEYELAYAANLWLRSATRVQELLLRTTVESPDAMYAAVQSIDWSRCMTVEQTLAVEAAVRDSFSTHSGFVALKVKDAVVDWFRERLRRRPSVDPKDPHLALHLVLRKNVMTLYRNLSGASLHKRGYRPIQVKSPLNEATAAGLLLASDWDRRSAIVDPMCGSATFLIEAAWIALRRAPGLGRRFAFERWPDFDRDAWIATKECAQGEMLKELPFQFEGSDHHAGALSLAERAIRAAQVHGHVKLTQADVDAYAPSVPFSTVFVNPPWGERLSEEESGDDVEDAWTRLSHFFHRKCGGATAYVLSGNESLTRLLGLRASRRIPVMVGPIECRLLKYEIRAKDEPPTDQDRGGSA
ncbi:MAG: RNA methyltransferase [Planctomycetes bacterium]|nr:RNA methyltransferase [Planctomycetota bacterium]